MCIPEILNKDADGGSAAVEITPLAFCFKAVYIGCQIFIVPLLNLHEMWHVGIYVGIAEF